MKFLCALLLVGFTSMPEQNSWAAKPCSWAPGGCSSRDTTPGGSYPSFSDSFNINPASIPTEKTPVGLEFVRSAYNGSWGSGETNFSFIKGFEKVGTGLSTNGDNTFYTYNIVQSVRGTQYQSEVTQLFAKSSITPTVNLGTAIDLDRKQLNLLKLPILGFELRYNRLTHQFEPGFGASVSSNAFTFGFSYVKERENSAINYPGGSTTTGTVGFKQGEFQLDYTLLYLRNDNALIEQVIPFYRKPLHFLTANYQRGYFLLSAAVRRVINIESKTVYDFMGSLNFKLSKGMSVGYFYNYIPDTQSLALQVFF